jgi:hypothetical protein
MARVPHDCPGSWLPGHGRKPGDVVVCDFCGLNVGVTAPVANRVMPDPLPR